MGCRIIVGHEAGCDYVEQAVLFCSTSMVAFGPVFESEQQAHEFCEWIPEDPRKYEHDNLMRAYHVFLDVWKRCYCESCGEFDKETVDGTCEYCLKRKAENEISKCEN